MPQLRAELRVERHSLLLRFHVALPRRLGLLRPPHQHRELGQCSQPAVLGEQFSVAQTERLGREGRAISDASGRRLRRPGGSWQPRSYTRGCARAAAARVDYV